MSDLSDEVEAAFAVYLSAGRAHDKTGEAVTAARIAYYAARDAEQADLKAALAVLVAE